MSQNTNSHLLKKWKRKIPPNTSKPVLKQLFRGNEKGQQPQKETRMMSEILILSKIRMASHKKR